MRLVHFEPEHAPSPELSLEGINRDALWTKPVGLDPDRVERMTRFWGDASWNEVAYVPEKDLFGRTAVVKRPGNEPIVKGYQERLRRLASSVRATSRS